MDENTLKRIFEPFFTTKVKGKGTGMGLATVYGIVRQNEGFVNVYSEKGRGTTFSIYLTRHRESSTAPKEVESSTIHAGGGELVLVTEDEPATSRLVERMRSSLGYQVLVAETPGVALDHAKEHGEAISLLITDVILPETNGRDLALELSRQFPSLRCLFMSGYTANVVAHQGVLEKGFIFLQKPFSKKELADKVRIALAAPASRTYMH